MYEKALSKNIKVYQSIVDFFDGSSVFLEYTGSVVIITSNKCFLILRVPSVYFSVFISYSD